MGELKTGLRLAWRKVSYPPPPPHYPKPAPFFATTPEKRNEKQRETFRLMKLSMDMQKLQTWVIHLQGFNDRTVQNEMLFFFFVKKKKKRSRSFEIPHTIQRESKVCMRLNWLLQLVLPEFCRNP